MSKFDQIELNIAHIVRRCEAVKPEAIFIRREMMHGERNMGNAPIVEIELDVVNREHLCDVDDIVRCVVSIRISDRVSNDELDRLRINRATAKVINALYEVPNINEPVDVGIISDWTVSTTRERADEIERVTVTLNLSMIVSKSEVL